MGVVCFVLCFAWIMLIDGVNVDISGSGGICLYVCNAHV